MRAMMSPMVPYLRTPTADELASDLAMTWSLQSTFLRVVMAIACFNAFGPMQLPAYAVSVGAMLGGQVVAAALAPPPGSDAGPLVLVLVDWAFLFIAAALLFFLRVQAILVERKTFHLQREVVALAQGEIAHRLREQTAVAVSTARSQLIRVVRAWRRVRRWQTARARAGRSARCLLSRRIVVHARALAHALAVPRARLATARAAAAPPRSAPRSRR
jgi:hypothetical protein